MPAPQYEQAGADIAGTGTANTIPRWTGASTLGDSGLIDNGTAIYTTTRNVGIGTPSPTDSGGWSAGRILDVRSGSAGSSAVAYFGDSARATNTQIGFYGTGYGFVGTVTNYDFRVLTNNATRGIWSSSSLDISATSGYGLKLPATNGTTYNTDPNTLDCYAEKDLTATMTCGTSGTITLSASTLKFTRVGRVVHVSGRLVINSVSSPLGRLQVDIGLGANERPSVYTSSTVWLNAWAAGFTQTPFGFIAPGGTILYVDRWGAGSMNIDAAQYAQANAEMMISLTYTV